MRNWLLFRIAVLMVCLSVPMFLQAQDSASLAGVVTDSSGALLPGATVSLVNTHTGVKATQKSDAHGAYRFASVPPAEGYDVTFAHAGFATFAVHDLALNVGLTRTQDAKLAAGSTEQVEVSAANQAVTLNTTDATIGNNLDVAELNELPVLDRTAGIATLFTDQPGVDAFSGAVTGARTDQTSVTLDGMDVNDLSTGQAFATVADAPVDSVEQFTGTVAGMVPSVGTGSGGQFQLVTKGGTNRFHGNINEYHRDTTTEANSWFNNLDSVPRTPLIRNQFGGNIGGPIIKDKLFFFFEINASRIIQSATNEVEVPLNNLLNGPANSTLNYINNGPGCSDTSRLNNQPNCISSLSATQVAALDPAGIGFNPNILSEFTSRYQPSNDPSQGDGVNTGGLRFTVPAPDLQTTYIGRIDYNLTSKHRVFGRFNINRETNDDNGNPGTLPQFPGDPVTHPITDHSYSYVVSDVWTINQNKVNQFYYGDTISKLSFPDVFNPTGINQYGFSGNLNNPYTSFDGQQRRIPVPVVRDDFNWQIKSHSLSFGGTFKFIKTHSNLISDFNNINIGLSGGLAGGLTTPGLRPADIFSDAAAVATTDYDNLFTNTLGAIGSISTNYTYNNAGQPLALATGGPRAYRYFETEFYVGDTWKVSPKLTLSYGLRYQLYSVPYEAHGDESVQFDENTNKPIDIDTFIQSRVAQIASPSPVLPISSYKLGGKVNHGPNLYNPSYKDFAPRFAFAYSSSPRTVFNGGAGLVYDRTVINAVNFLQDQLSYLFSNTSTNDLGTGATAAQILASAPRISGSFVGASPAFPTSAIPAAQAVTPPYTPFVSGGVPFGLSIGEVNFITSQNLRDPYSIALNAGVQQELPGHLVMKLNYVGRLGRRLLANADSNQVIDVPDVSGKSTQTMAQAFAALTTQLRAGVPIGSLTKQPWFENVLGSGYAAPNGLPDNTNLVAAIVGPDGNRGDISDMLQLLAEETQKLTGLLPTNIGIPSQFGTNEYLTNKGFSSYHGLLLTMSKNMSYGLRFNFNYTWSHSIDNTSLISNANPLTSGNPTGVICDLLQPRACRGSSDFDVRQEIASDFVYELPFGHGRQFLNSSSKWVDEAIGGWSFSGLPSYRTGTSVSALSHAFLASFENDDPAIFTGNKGDLRVKINTDHTTNTVYAFAGGLAGSTKVFNEFRGPVGIEYGQRNLFKGPGAFNFEAGLGKNFPILENKLNLQFRADAFNIFNHANFENPTLDIVANASPFGQITNTNQGGGTAANVDAARVAQFSLRLEF
jgi:hypothetical protein